MQSALFVRIVRAVSFLTLVSPFAVPAAALLTIDRPPAGERNWLQTPLCFEAYGPPGAPAQEFLANSPGYSVRLSGTGAVVTLFNYQTIRPSVSLPLRATPSGPDKAGAPPLVQVYLKLVGANPAAQPVAADKLPGTRNYFLGNDPAQWRTNIANYGQVKVPGVYPGVDWFCHGNQQQLEYDFVVAPGGDPASIAIRYEGAKQLCVAPGGDLVIKTVTGDLRQDRPIIYQQIGGARRNIAGSYACVDARTVRFHVGEYDRSAPLIIDPTLAYSTLLGHSNEFANPMSIAVDASGNAYVAGISAVTNGVGTPVTHVFVTKLNSNGVPVYGGLIGGTIGGGELPGQIAVDSQGNAHLTGTTKSSNFPIMNALQPGLRGMSDAFVLEINPAGNGFVYSTYLGATRSSANPDSGNEFGFSLAVDGVGSTYVAGTTASAFFLRDLEAETLNHVQSQLEGASDAFLVKLSPDGLHLLYATYLGGSGSDARLALMRNGSSL